MTPQNHSHLENKSLRELQRFLDHLFLPVVNQVIISNNSLGADIFTQNPRNLVTTNPTALKQHMEVGHGV